MEQGNTVNLYANSVKKSGVNMPEHNFFLFVINDYYFSKLLKYGQLTNNSPADERLTIIIFDATYSFI